MKTVLFVCIHNSGRSQMAEVSKMRDEIRKRVEKLLLEL